MKLYESFFEDMGKARSNLADLQSSISKKKTHLQKLYVGIHGVYLVTSPEKLEELKKKASSDLNGLLSQESALQHDFDTKLALFVGVAQKLHSLNKLPKHLIMDQ